MQKVRIKKAPQLGEQVDYSFYDSRYRNMGMGGSSESEVKNTMGPVPREEANIEVELGEVVVGDTNQDGFLELFTFTGKPHSKGGTPVNIPPGSFIFSNTKKLFIKDETLLKELFGLPPRKGGYAPAEIAKKYQINEYVEKLRNADSDALTKRTAQTVLDKNLEKLGELALVQESMKGFPDGIPSIALPAAAKMGLTTESLKDMKAQQSQQQMPQQGQQPMMQSSPQEEMMEPVQSPQEESQEFAPEMMQGMMRYGGRTLRKYQDAGTQTEDATGFSRQDLIPIAKDLMRRGMWEGDNQPWWKNSQGDFIGPINQPYEQGQEFLVPKKGTKFFINDTDMVTVVDASPTNVIGQSRLGDPFKIPYIKLDNGMVISQAELIYLLSTGKNQYVPNQGVTDEGNQLRQKVRSSLNPYGNRPSLVGYRSSEDISLNPTVRQRSILDTKGRQVGFDVSSGDKITWDGTEYNVITPYGEFTKDYQHSGKRILDTFDNTQGIIMLRDEAGNPKFIEGEDLADAYKIAKSTLDFKPGAYLESILQAANGDILIKTNDLEKEAGSLNSSVEGNLMMNPDSIMSTLKTNPDTSYVYDTNTNQEIGIVQKPVDIQEKDTSKKEKKKKDNSSGLKTVTFKDFKYGGSSKLPVYQTAGTVRPAGSYQQDGKTYYVFYDDSDNTKFATSDPEGKNIVVAKTKRDASDVKFNQYGSKEIQDIIDESPNIIRTGINRGNFGTQKPISGTGLYSFGKDTESWKTLPDEWWEDLKKRHGDWIEKDYTGGFEQFKKDLESSKGTDTAGWFQDQVNKYVQNQFGKTYFTPLDQKQTTPYTRDSKFGFVTFSVPRFFDVPVTEVPKDTPPPIIETPEPGKLKAYYCVEAEDGSKSVQEIEYAEGSQPTPPIGKTVTPYPSRGAADAGCTTVGKITNTSRKFPYTTDWDIKDLTNFMGTITDKPFNRQSALTQVPDVSMGYQLLDPTYESERIRSVKTGQDQLLANMLPPQVAAAVMASNTGDFLDRHAAEISRVNDQNAQIVNTAMGANAQLQASNNAQNAQLLDRYRTNTFNNRLANARGQNEDKWREIAAFNRGMKGVQDINALRRMYPHSAADQTFHMTGFAGAPDASIFGPDVSSMGAMGMMGTTNMNQNALSIADQARKEALNAGFGADAAEKFALSAYNKVLSNSSPRGTAQSAYSNSMMFGNNSMPAFGALSYNPYEQD
jgi:hypothetical protein